MNRKKIFIGILSLGLIGMIGVGGSLAWFTDTEIKSNNFVMGKIDVTLTEEGPEDAEVTDDGIIYKNVMPGSHLKKVVTVSNVEESAWVRLKVSINTNSKLDIQKINELEFYKDEVKINFDLSDWILNQQEQKFENYITCPNILDTDDTYVFFDTVIIPGEWNNDMAKETVIIDVQAQAVQSANNPDGFSSITEEDFE